MYKNLSLALQLFDTPRKGCSKPYISILEMASGIPDQGAVSIPELCFQQFIFAPYTVAHSCNRPVLHMLLLVSQAQVHLCGLYRMSFSKVKPVPDPEGRRCRCDSRKTIRLRRRPEGEESPKGVTTKNNGQFSVFVFKRRQE